MNFTFACPHCSQPISTTSDKSGTALLCLNCRNSITVPQQSASSPPPETDTEPQPFIKKAFVFGIGLLSALYLINPTAGFIELLPDNIPILGNLDEVSATLILLRCLTYFGVDLRKIIDPRKKED